MFFLLGLNNNMGKMASLKLNCAKSKPLTNTHRAQRGSQHPLYRIIQTLSLKKTLTSRAYDGVILVSRMIIMTSKCSPSAQRPPAKKSGKSPPRRHSSSKTLQTDANGDKIQQKLADIALKRWGKKLSSDKI